MKTIARLANAAADRTPHGAAEDALGLAALCVMVFAGLAVTGLA